MAGEAESNRGLSHQVVLPAQACQLKSLQMKENGFVISQEDESQAQVVLYGLPMGGFVVLLIMLNQELVITETQGDSPRGSTWPWLSLLTVPDRSHVPISPPSHQQASGEHAPCPSLLAAGPTQSWARFCIPAPPQPGSQELQLCIRPESGSIGKEREKWGCPWLRGQQTDKLQPDCPAPCLMLLPLCSGPHGKGGHTHYFIYFLISSLPL